MHLLMADDKRVITTRINSDKVSTTRHINNIAYGVHEDHCPFYVSFDMQFSRIFRTTNNNANFFQLLS